MQNEGKVLKKAVIAVAFSTLIIAAIVVGYFLAKPDTSVRQSKTLDTSVTQESMVRHANGDFIYSPPEESIAFNETKYVVFMMMC